MYSFIVSVSLLVSRFANEKVRPLVYEMDQNSEMSKDIIKGMFEQGVSTVHRYKLTCLVYLCIHSSITVHV